MTGPLGPEAFELDEIIDGLRTWIEVESPTMAPDGVNRMMALAEQAMLELDAKVTRYPGPPGTGDSLLARLPWGEEDEPGILVLAHLDTVHPVGTLAKLPYRVDGDRLYGPGVYDMKGATYCAWYAVREIIRRDGRTPLPLSFLFTPDEEVGSPTSRGLIEEQAARNRYVLVPEPAQERGNLITGRWAFQRFTLEAHGAPAHAGATLASGRSAIREIAEQIVAVESMSEPARHVTLSVGVVHGGTFVNVVPAQCSAQVLAVTPTEKDFAAVRHQMTGLQPLHQGIDLRVIPGPVRPLWEPGDAGLALYETARQLAVSIGFEPGHGTVGGGSDGNFTGSLGIPTLDGLGLVGGGFHTLEEHAQVSAIIPRARLFSGLLRTLGAG